MRELADIHCHILPYVDDGAEHLEDAQRLLEMDAQQGVRVVCATPHLRKGMFESDDEAVWRQYDRVQALIAEAGLPMDLYLGREYFCDETFLKRLDRQDLLPLGNGNTLLTEFSGRMSFDVIAERVRLIRQAGYDLLIAHVERYPAVSDVGYAQELTDLGARLQVNAGSLLGREGLRQKRFAWKLLRQGLADVVASDAHDAQYRPPEIGACADKIEKKLGKSRADALLWDNPFHIVNPE